MLDLSRRSPWAKRDAGSLKSKTAFVQFEFKPRLHPNAAHLKVGLGPPSELYPACWMLDGFQFCQQKYVMVDSGGSTFTNF